MHENFIIEATARKDEGKGASRRLRRAGMLPGIIYGGNKEPQMITTSQIKLALHLEHEAFYSHILQVNVDGASESVILKALQRHPAKPIILHIDLQRVGDTDRIKMHVPLHFIGEEVAPGVKAGGRVSHNMTDIEVLCQAKSLPEFIEVDVSGMNIGDLLHLSDLKLPEGVEVFALTQGIDHDAAVVSLIEEHL